MFDYFEELRKRPEHERRRVLIFCSVLITVIIFLLWVFSVQSIISVKLKERRTYGDTPLSGLQKAAAGMFDDLGGAVFGNEVETPQAGSEKGGEEPSKTARPVLE